MLSKKVIKYIQSLIHKKLRDEHGVFTAEGPKVVAELLSSQNFSCKIICAEKEWVGKNKNLFKIASPDIFEIDEESLKKISLWKTPNKVLAVFEKKASNIHPQVDNKITLMLDDISDPGNLGTIIRIADWFGIDNIICSEHCVDCYNHKVVQSTMGSLARISIFYTSLQSFITSHRNISVYAATLSGVPVSEFKGLQEGIILIGNESKGINEDLLKMSAKKITIPRFGHAESLNAAVASGIILSHLVLPKVKIVS